MADPALNEILKWGVKNSDASRNVPSAPPPRRMSASDREAFEHFLAGIKGVSETEQIDPNLDIIESKDAHPDDKYTALENLETIVGQVDNAHNLENENRWTRLIGQLENEDPVIRGLAALCCGTAVQNNVRSQERLLIMGAIPTLVRIATKESVPKTRKQAISALSSAIRNFQPNLDAAVSHMPAEYKPKKKLDANDMDSVDILINRLRKSI